MKLDEAIDAILKEVDPTTLSFYHPSRDFILTEEALTTEEAKKITRE